MNQSAHIITVIFLTCSPFDPKPVCTAVCSLTLPFMLVLYIIMYSLFYIARTETHAFFLETCTSEMRIYMLHMH